MKTALYQYLLKDCVCSPASIDWIDKESITDPQVAWDTCQDGSALLWIATKHLDKPGWPTHQEVVLAACDCVDLALYLVLEGEGRPRIAIETARRWVDGKATVEECIEASSYTIEDVYRTQTRCVSNAAHSAVCASCAVSAPESASSAAYSAAYAIGLSGGNAKQALAVMADIVRERLYLGEIKL